MIHSIENLNQRIADCTACFQDKLAGADDKRHIVLCGGTGCLSNNSAEIRQRFVEVLERRGASDRATVNQVGCFGFCSQGPFVKIYPEDTLYRLVQIEDVEEIVDSDIIHGNVVERLLYQDIKSSGAWRCTAAASSTPRTSTRPWATARSRD